MGIIIVIMNPDNLGVKLRSLLKTKIMTRCFKNIKIPSIGPSTRSVIVSRCPCVALYVD